MRTQKNIIDHRQHKPHLLCFLILGLFLHMPAFALSLSTAQVHSHLNEPLDITIPLRTVPPGEKDLLTIQLKPLQGISAGLGLRHEIIEKNRQVYLAVTSRRSVREPLLGFSVEVSWSGGTIQRDYQILVDPKPLD